MTHSLYYYININIDRSFTRSYTISYTASTRNRSITRSLQMRKKSISTRKTIPYCTSVAERCFFFLILEKSEERREPQVSEKIEALRRSAKRRYDGRQRGVTAGGKECLRKKTCSFFAVRLSGIGGRCSKEAFRSRAFANAASRTIRSSYKYCSCTWYSYIRTGVDSSMQQQHQVSSRFLSGAVRGDTMQCNAMRWHARRLYRVHE